MVSSESAGARDADRLALRREVAGGGVGRSARSMNGSKHSAWERLRFRGYLLREVARSPDLLTWGPAIPPP
ncbi:hypothetical protein SKAU_G00322730 [Synaphobranchus kaupii]|uniref:Uncharacterized protein n=1 Tax=Synaphobranchus kaupii TaxID=118154 RepID=A0A9Q1IJ03_SYNKA|nr:hypothetical protein SKAU_G00322730 [Synaphobranchus kaupii]